VVGVRPVCRPAVGGLGRERSGGWHWTWVVTGTAAVLGLLLARRIAVLLRAAAPAPPAALPDNSRRAG
jgi:hypothetical protein